MFKWEGVHHHPARLKREKVFIAHQFTAAKELHWRAILPPCKEKALRYLVFLLYS